MTSHFQRKTAVKILAPHGRQAWTELVFCPMALVRSKDRRRQLEETCSNCFQMRISSIKSKNHFKTLSYEIHRTWCRWNNHRPRRHLHPSPVCFHFNKWWLMIWMLNIIRRCYPSHSIITRPIQPTKLSHSVPVIKRTSTMRMLDHRGYCPSHRFHRFLLPTCTRINPIRISSRFFRWFRLPRTIRQRTFAIGSATFPTNNRATTMASSRFLYFLRKSSSVGSLGSPPKPISMRISIVLVSSKFNGPNCTVDTRSNTGKMDSSTLSSTMPSQCAHYWTVVHVIRTTMRVPITSSISKQQQARERRSKWFHGISETTIMPFGKDPFRMLGIERRDFFVVV